MPLAPDVIVIHDALLVAVHAHAAFEAFTLTLPDPAAAVNDAVAEVKE